MNQEKSGKSPSNIALLLYIFGMTYSAPPSHERKGKEKQQFHIQIPKHAHQTMTEPTLTVMETKKKEASSTNR